MMNLHEQNVPQSYKDFMANNSNNQAIDLIDENNDYLIYSYEMLIANNPYDKKSPANYQTLIDAELTYKALEGDIENIDVELLRTAFVFGSVDSGKLFFHPETQAIYIIYLDLYVKKVADSFDEFLENTSRFDEWEE